jgi:hypothetical protein
MAATSCSCGFTELDDESVTGHLHAVFAPGDSVGNDGQVHEEGKALTCFCGYTAGTTGEFDHHFLAVFTPDDAIGQDGNVHTVLYAA